MNSYYTDGGFGGAHVDCGLTKLAARVLWIDSGSMHYYLTCTWGLSIKLVYTDGSSGAYVNNGI